MIIIGRNILLLIILVIPGAGFSDTQTPDIRAEFKIGYHIHSFPDLTLSDSIHTLDFLTKELGKSTKLEVYNFPYNDIKKMRDDFNLGVFNFVILPPLTIIKFYDIELLRGGLNATANNQSLDMLQLITRKQDGVDNIRALQGKRMSLLENESFSEFYLEHLVSQITKKGKSHFFSNVDNRKKSQRLIFELFFKRTDAILVYKSQLLLAIEMNPQIGKAIQVIEQIENVPRGIGFFHKNVNKKMRESIILQVLKYQGSVRGQQLLEILKADQIKRSYLSDLQVVNDLFFGNKQFNKTK